MADVFVAGWLGSPSVFQEKKVGEKKENKFKKKKKKPSF